MQEEYFNWKNKKIETQKRLEKLLKEDKNLSIFVLFNICLKLWKIKEIKERNKYATEYVDLMHEAIDYYIDNKSTDVIIENPEKIRKRKLNRKYYENRKKKYGIKDKVVYSTKEESLKAKREINKRYYEKNKETILKKHKERRNEQKSKK